METAYKVVHIKGGKMLSAFTSNSERLRLEYQLGKWTTAKIGKVFCFDNKRDAESFAKCPADQPSEVWLAEVRDPEPPTMLIAWTGHWPTVERHIRALWGGNIKYLKRLMRQRNFSFFPPKGTVVCSSIRLMAKARNDNE